MLRQAQQAACPARMRFLQARVPLRCWLARIPQAHRTANDGAWPETVAVNLWGLDSIKTKGESGEA